MSLIKSPNDKKEYRVITLENGLTAMLISDLHSAVGVVEQKKQSNENQETLECGGYDSGRESQDEGSSSDSFVGTSEDELEGNIEKTSHQKMHGKNKLAAAALCVGVGSFSDPDYLPGLAHFLEHMIFMGNEKYPEENYFDASVSKYGGSNNAYTDCERTIYHLDVTPKYLHEILDIFAACFVSPLLKVDSMDREIEAVDSEFQLSSPIDSERMDLLLGSCAKNGHPMTKFFWGNTKSLKDDPQLKNIDINAQLQMFWKRYYSSHCMTLAVISPESLDVLESWVRKFFSTIPNTGLPHPSFTSLEEPFKTDRFHKLYKIVPVQDTHHVAISWALPSLEKYYRVKPLHYLGYIIGHEGKGSIIAHLRARSLALELEAGNSGYGFESNSTCSLFCITIDLTENGMDNIFEVISVVFQYLKLLRIKGPQKRIFEDIKAIEDNSFRFQKEVDKSLYVEEIVKNMQLYPPEHYLVGDKIHFDYDEEIIGACEDALTFEAANVMILSSRYFNKNICNEKEPWTQASYCSCDFPPDWVKHLNELDVHPDLHLPGENEYIAKNFALKEEAAFTGQEYPIKILEDEYGCLWYKKDTKFKVPKGYILFHLLSPMITSCPLNSATMDLWINCLNQTFAEDLYPAEAARLSYSVYADDTGLILKVHGFDHKLSYLFETMLLKVVNFSVSETLFTNMKNNLFKAYYNSLIKPGKLCKDVRLYIVHQTHFSIVEKRIALKEITRQGLLEFSKIFLSSIFIEGLVQGNFTVEEALSLNAMIKEKTDTYPLKPECFPQVPVTKLPEGEAYCRISSFNTTDANSVVINYYQLGPGKIKTTCLMELFLNIMNEPCFDVLRTKEMLGYDVSCQFKNNYGVIGFAVSVKSPGNKFSCSHINERIEAFLQTFVGNLQNLSEEEFNIQKASLIALKKCEDLNLKEEVDRNWIEILMKSYLFDRTNLEIQCLESLTLDDFKHYAQEHLSSNGSRIRKLGVQIVGCGACDNSDSIAALPNISPENLSGSTEKRNANDTEEEIYNLHFLGPSESDPSFINNIAKYKDGLEVYPFCIIIS